MRVDALYKIKDPLKQDGEKFDAGGGKQLIRRRKVFDASPVKVKEPLEVEGNVVDAGEGKQLMGRGAVFDAGFHPIQGQRATRGRGLLKEFAV